MLGKMLKDLRKKKKMTQAETASKLGIARTTYAMYEQNNRKPDYETLQKIADFFDVSTDYLFGRSKCLTYPGVLEDVQDLRILEELKKHPAPYEELHSNPKVACETLMKFLEFKKTLHKN